MQFAYQNPNPCKSQKPPHLHWSKRLPVKESWGKAKWQTTEPKGCAEWICYARRTAGSPCTPPLCTSTPGTASLLVTQQIEQHWKMCFCCTWLTAAVGPSWPRQSSRTTFSTYNWISVLWASSEALQKMAVAYRQAARLGPRSIITPCDENLGAKLFQISGDNFCTLQTQL